MFVNIRRERPGSIDIIVAVGSAVKIRYICRYFEPEVAWI